MTGFNDLGHSGHFPNPFNDIASLHMPKSMPTVFRYAEYIYSSFGTYRMASERVISYFITDIEISDASDAEAEKWESFLVDVIDVKGWLKKLARDAQCYGNALTSVIVPFKRFLVCPKCHMQVALAEAHSNNVFNFSYHPGEPEQAFRATCPACKVGSGYSGPWIVKDEDDDEDKKLKTKIWPIHEIEILHDLYGHDSAYLWRIPENYKWQVRNTGPDGKGHLYHLERCPKEVMRAIARNQRYRFDDDAIFHMREPSLSGQYTMGWGVPRILWNFRQIWYVQVLRRYNEAIALDYVIPFRVITPPLSSARTGAGSGGLPVDPLHLMSGNDFKASVNRMIRDRRRDPASIQTLPFPAEFQTYGADANQLAPRDLLDQGNATLLNDMGAPVELYNGSLQLQAAPVALRLFESTHHHVVHDANAALNWLVQQVAQILSWEVVTAKLQRVTVADNMEKQMMEAQLMMSKLMSGTSMFRSIGHDYKKEQKLIAEEDRFQAELQTRNQEEMDQAGFAQQMAKGQPAQGGAPAPGGAAGGAPAGGAAPGAEGQPMDPYASGPVSQYLAASGNTSQVTLDQIIPVADSLAASLLGLPESVKDSELRKLSKSNPALHALVKSKMAKNREQSRQQATQSMTMQGMAI